METTTNRRTTEEQGTCQDDEPLTPQQQAVLRVLAKAEFPLKGRAVATRAGIRYTSHFRELMTELKQMGLVIFHPEEGGYRKGDPDAVAAVLDEPPRDVPPAVLPALLEILIRVLTRATVRLVIEFDPESEADAPAPAPAASEIRPVTPLEEEIIALCRRAEKPLKGHTVASRLGRSFSSHLRETLAEMVRGGRLLRGRKNVDGEYVNGYVLPAETAVPPVAPPVEEEVEEVLQALDEANGRRLDSREIAAKVGRPCGRALFDLLAGMVKRDLVDFQHGKGYARAGAASQDEEGEDDAPLSNADLAERVAAARAEKARTNGHASNLD